MSTLHLTAIDDAAWDSPWRRRRCAEKVLLSLGLVVTALVLPPWPASLLVALASLALVLGWARIPARLLAAVMAAPAAFIVLGAATVALRVGADDPALWRRGVLSVSTGSLRQAGAVAAHGCAGTLALMVLATTTPLVDLLTWLRGLRVPAPLLEIASLTYRLIFVVLDTLLAVRTAQAGRLGLERGAGRRGWLRPWRTSADGLGHVLTRSWHRAARLEEGLALRGDLDRLGTVARPHTASLPLLATAVLLPVAIVAASLAVSR